MGNFVKGATRAVKPLTNVTRDENATRYENSIILSIAAEPSDGLAGTPATALNSVLNLTSLDGKTGFHIAGLRSGDFSGRTVALIGDLNGDGFGDFVIGAPGAGVNGKSSAGQCFVVFGHGGEFAPNFDLSTLNGVNGFRLDGIYSNDHLGTVVAAAGDMNGDGLDDLVVSSSSTNSVGAGSVFVIFGRSHGYDAVVDVAALDGHTGFSMSGPTNGPWTESSAASADVNHDGFDDLIFGAKYDFVGNNPNGLVYVVLGHAGAFTPAFSVTSLNGANGFRIGGLTYNQGLGESVSSAGDINGDGIEDVAIMAAAESKAFILFGHAGNFDATVDLAALNGANGFVFATGDTSASAKIASIGDINGDGNDDLLIGARNTSISGSFTGAAYVVFGHSGTFPANLAASSLDGTNGFRIDGLTAFDSLGMSIAPAGDFNGDGLQDFILGAQFADPGGVQNAGSSFVVYGRTGGYYPTLDLATLDGTNGFRIDGTLAQGQSATALAGGGDINGDGFDDIIVSVPNESNGAQQNAGGAYVIFGHATPPNTTIIGTAQNDRLIGHDGDDRIDGRGGADSLFGLLGNDTYLADRADDLVFENANEGTDTVIASAGYYLYANIENLTLAAGAGDIFGVGNELANVITGNEGSNLLIAGAGTDIVHGGGGIDSLFGQDGNDQLFGDSGVDYLVGGTGDDMLDGGAGADALYGEDGNDVLWGGTDFQTDILVGGAGNDILHGDSGLGDYDLIDGGAGDDTYYVDTPADLTFEAVGGGNDTVRANIVGAGYYLYANVENLILDGVTPFGVGNELNNQLTGNAIGNYLLGGGGDDVLNGKAGRDVLFGEAGADTFVFEHGTGADVIGDFAAGTDKIDLTAIGYSWQQVQAAMHQNGGNTAIDLGGGDLIALNGVTIAQLQQSDFVLLAGTSGDAPAPQAVAPVLGVAGFQVGLDTLSALHDPGNAVNTPAWALGGHAPHLAALGFVETLAPIDTSTALAF